MDPETGFLPTINIYTLSYDFKKNLIGDPHGVTRSTPLLLHQNLKNYLEEFRIISDTVNIQDGYIINFGVFFDVVAHKFANKKEVKLRCIDRIKAYFAISKMQYKQPIYTSDLEYLLMDIEGVRAVNYVCLTQENNHIGEGELKRPTYDATIVNGIAAPRDASLNAEYGYQYDFSIFYGTGAVAGPGVILPSASPSVFELKNPNQNIVGVVR